MKQENFIDCFIEKMMEEIKIFCGLDEIVTWILNRYEDGYIWRPFMAWVKEAKFIFPRGQIIYIAGQIFITYSQIILYSGPNF